MVLETAAGKKIGVFDTPWVLGANPKLDANYLFHKIPLFVSAPLVIGLPTAKPVHSIQDLHGKKVALTQGTYITPEFDQDSAIDKNFGNGSDYLALKKMMLGRTDYAIVFDKVFEYVASGHKDEFHGKIKVLGNLGGVPCYVAFSKSHPDSPVALSLLNKGMDIIKSNGTYDRIQKEWDAKYQW